MCSLRLSIYRDKTYHDIAQNTAMTNDRTLGRFWINTPYFAITAQLWGLRHAAFGENDGAIWVTSHGRWGISLKPATELFVKGFILAVDKETKKLPTTDPLCWKSQAIDA